MENKKPSPDTPIKVSNVVFTHQDFFAVIDTFYKKVAVDPMLKVPFSSVHDWPEHIERLTHFWWIRFGGEPYMFTFYNPIEKHFFAGFNPEFLKHWLHLFHETLNEHLNPDQVRLWKTISERMGESLNERNEMYKKMYNENNS